MTMPSRHSHLFIFHRNYSIPASEKCSSSFCIQHCRKHWRFFSSDFTLRSKIFSARETSNICFRCLASLWSFRKRHPKQAHAVAKTVFYAIYFWLILIEIGTHSPLKNDCICGKIDRKIFNSNAGRPCRFSIEINDKKEIAAPWDFEGINFQVACAARDEYSLCITLHIISYDDDT